MSWVLILIFRGSLNVFPTDTIGTAYFATEQACKDAGLAAIQARREIKEKGEQQITDEGLFATFLCMPSGTE